ncbi:MAG: hypothetical protein ILP19_09830, partial [Oscillospiraceae bacterium]|nr:hypothetical protein [Oscillospiraceae bacterium]
VKQSGIDEADIKCSHIRTAMTDWLVSKDLLRVVTDDEGHTSKAVTEHSSEHGIYEEQRQSQAGAQYVRICYSEQAQQMILSSLPAIAEYAQRS